MREYRPEPIGQVHLTPSQKREQYIKKLEHWIIVLGIADVLFTVLMIIILTQEVFMR